MTKMEILLKITPAVLIVRKLTPKTGGKRQNRGSLLDSLLLIIKKYIILYNIYNSKN